MLHGAALPNHYHAQSVPPINFAGVKYPTLEFMPPTPFVQYPPLAIAKPMPIVKETKPIPVPPSPTETEWGSPRRPS